MSTVLLDIVDGSSIREDVNGKRVVRVAIIHSVSGTAAQWLKNAHEDVGLPAIDDAHPNITGLKLIEKTTRGVRGQCDLAFVQLVYGKEPSGGSFANKVAADKDGPTIIRGSFRLKPVQRFHDHAATPALLALQPPQTVKDDTDAYTETQKKTQVATINTLEPVHVIQHERLEDEDPSGRISSNIGKRNSVTHGSYAAKTILFEGADYMSDDGGTTWQVTYHFAVDEDELHEVPSVEWIDPLTGAPHPSNSTTAATGYTHPSKREDLEVTRGDADLETTLSLDF